MSSDMRDELVTIAKAHLCDEGFDRPVPVGAVLDSIPPGSYKLDDRTWVRREVVNAATAAELAEHWENCPLPPDADCGSCYRYAGMVHLAPLYTEVDSAE